MKLKVNLLGKTYEFKSIKDVLAKANEEKSGDKLAGVAAETMSERIAAKVCLSELLVKDLRENPVVPYESDEVTRMIQDDLDLASYEEIKHMSLGALREWILDDGVTSGDILRASRGMTSEVVAGVCKLMSNMDLVCAARKIQVQTHCNTVMGEPGTLSFRLQPNHPTDNTKGILASLYEGLSYGAGDALLGLNPVEDTLNSVCEVLKLFDNARNTLEIPTQICVLAHVTTQMECLKKGVPLDLVFQSIAGSQKGNEAFGVSAALLQAAMDMALAAGNTQGPNVMYFETGQGSELSSESHHGADQVTMEARCYGLARHYQPFLVNTVVGFIGPEYLYDSKQVIRAGLEDHFMGKLSGLPMGCDVCYTNHMKADQNDIENLSILLATAGCYYLIGTPLGDDVMLNYQTASFHDMVALRSLLGLKPAAQFNQWLHRWGILENGKPTKRMGDLTIFAGEGR